MNRRDFLGDFLGLAPLAVGPRALAATADPPPPSLAARAGLFPNVPLVAHTGEKLNFYDDLVRDKTILLNFFIVGCQDGRCPTATANLRRVQDLLGERMGRDIFFDSISLQPEKDTPDVLKAYAAAFDVKPGWLFLSGRPADVDLLRRRLGYVDANPKRDRNPLNHIAMARYGDDRLERWGAISLTSSAANIASTFAWLSL